MEPPFTVPFLIVPAFDGPGYDGSPITQDSLQEKKVEKMKVKEEVMSGLPIVVAYNSLRYRLVVGPYQCIAVLLEN